MNKIENPYWSQEQKQIIEDVLKGWSFTFAQQNILRQQMKEIKNYEFVLESLFTSNNDWDTLQLNLLTQLNFSQEISYDSQLYYSNQSQQFQQNTPTTTNQQGSQSIRNYQEIRNPQYSQSNLNSDIYSYEANSLLQQNQTLTINDQLQAEFNALNKKDFSQVFNLVDSVYQILGAENEASSLNFSNLYFSNSTSLTGEDLINLCNGVKQIFSYYPRKVQLISVVSLYNHEQNQGRLAQIYTGEGKTLIVAMLAVLLCKKKNCNVDIVTSSSVLAERDSKDYTRFYQYFDLRASHNIHKDQAIQEGVLPCYNCQIIYGDAQSFQGDILRHEYSEQGTMGTRKQQYAIIDEVDSMLIDGHSNKTLLSSPIPGMLDLSKVLQLIWDEICKVQPYISTDFKVMITDKDNYYSADLDEYIVKTLDNQLKDCVKEFIPNFRLKYINHMKKTWIKNAITAKFYLKEKKDYVIDNGLVRIVDYQNTGVISSGNTQWEKGLHQFIQLKHHVNVTPLSITTNYLSNVTFFKRYGEKLLGLTGTLGSQNNQNLLAKQYRVDFIFVPPFKKRNLREENSVAVQGEEDWLNEISRSVQEQMVKKRAVLIINRTIQEVVKVENVLKRQHKNIIKYTDDSQLIPKQIGPQVIVIATNLAGRGTDLITNQQLEDNGGLHVILSFLPQSIRTQEQGFGRTCRQGKKGSAQLIVQFQQCLYTNPEQNFQKVEQAIEFYQKQVKQKSLNLIEVVKFFRDTNERYYMQQIEKDMEKLLHEDRCFDKFCQIAKKKVNLKQNRQGFRSLEEKWGLFLEINQENGIRFQDIEGYMNSEENENPKYLILEGLQQNNLDKISKAAQEKNDPQAQYYKGLLQLEKKQYQQGTQSLLKAKELFQNKIENERGFAFAAKINQQQIQYFEKEEVLPEKKINFAVSDFEKMQSGVFSKMADPLDFGPQSKIYKKPTQDRVTQKVNNQIKVYEKVIDNIDDIINTLQNFNQEKEEIDLDWVHVLDKEEQLAEEDSTIKDKKEVINDGPLPKLGKITKKEKPGIGNYIGLFFFGLCQFAVGAAISVFSCGAAMPIANALMGNGFENIVLSVTSYFNGIDIDWAEWRQKQLLHFTAALCLAGPAGIKDAIDSGRKAMQSIKQEGFGQFCRKIGEVSADELQKCGATLTQGQKEVVEKCNEVLQQVTKLANLNLNFETCTQLAQDLIEDQVQSGNISQDTANEMAEIVSESVNMAKEKDTSLAGTLALMGAKFLKVQIGKSKANSMEPQNQVEVFQIYENQCQTKYNQVKDQIGDFEQYKERLTNELNRFSRNFWSCFSQDLQLQKQVITTDLYLELQCDFQKVQNQVNCSGIQKLIRQNFNLTNKEFRAACLNLRISDQQSMMQFYNERIGPIIKQIVQHFSSQFKITEPLEILVNKQLQKQNAILADQLNQQKQNLENQKIQLEQERQGLNQSQNQQQFDYYNNMVESFNKQHEQFQQLRQQAQEFQPQKINQIIQNLVQHLIKNQMIMGNGLSFSNTIMQEVNKCLANNNSNPVLQEQIQQAMNQSIQQAQRTYQGCKKLFSALLQQSIELQVLDEIKKYIFEQKMQQEDKKILEEIE